MTQNGQTRLAESSVLGGVDVGGTKIQVAVTDRTFRVLGEAREPTPREGGPVAVAREIARLVQAALRDAGADHLDALGVGTPGTVDRATGTVSRAANLDGWIKPFALGPHLQSLLHTRVVIENDARAGMLGEYRLGAGHPFQDVMGVWFGTGVGGALVLGGELRRGPAGASGEIGHTVVKPGGRLCGCGRRGCLEAYAGRQAMERRARDLKRRGAHTELFRIMARSDRDNVTSGVVARALKAGDRLTEELIEEAIDAAGSALASAANLLDLEAIVIGGGLGTRLGAPFAERIAAAMQPHLWIDGEHAVRVVPGALGDIAGALGGAVEAAALAAEPVRAPRPAGRNAEPARSAGRNAEPARSAGRNAEPARSAARIGEPARPAKPDARTRGR